MIRNTRLPSVMKDRFSQAPQVGVQRSTFDRSHGYKTTFNAGDLIPVLVDEILPGDTFKVRASYFGRMITPITPIMDNLFLDTFYFFVPSRLVWDNWQKFMGERTDPGDSIDFLIPEVEIPIDQENTLADYFGIPVQNLTSAKTVNALPFRCYNLIYNEWFRDQNLIDSAVVDRDDGPDTYSDYVIRKRGKRHDYFTSCLPWPQKGDAVDLPLGTSAPVELDMSLAGTSQFFVDRTDYITKESGDLSASSTAGIRTNDINTAVFDPNGTLIADLSEATAATINSIREAFQVQRLLEKDARGGTRYTEILKSHFQVTSPDARLQRPEYLGGNSGTVRISPIPQTSETTVDSPQGNLAAYATFQSVEFAFSQSFVEHGYIIGLINVRADITYQQGLDRMWSRETRYDFYWPTLSHLGEQAVLQQEIYTLGDDPSDETVFGYQERYAEYRYKPSKITGQMRSGVTDTFDIWHLSQNFSSAPVLNQTFIEDNPPLDRIIAVTESVDFLLDSHFDMKCTRPMPVYSIPGYIDHF